MKENKSIKWIITIIICFIVGITTNPMVSSIKISNDLRVNDLNLSSDRRVIMLTGFWEPTGQMIAQFSTDPELNPEGWKGENWENLGYDIYSYFPKPDNNDHTAGETEYIVQFSSAVHRDNLFAVQFHPEKSGKKGLMLLSNFLNWEV